jgi:hypothetical protein
VVKYDKLHYPFNMCTFPQAVNKPT